MHTALQQLGADRYTLMGHSIAGIYALQYSTVFAEELIAFVGIDSSVPGQSGWDEAVPSDGLVALRDLRLAFALRAAGSPEFAGQVVSFDGEHFLHHTRSEEIAVVPQRTADTLTA